MPVRVNLLDSEVLYPVVQNLERRRVRIVRHVVVRKQSEGITRRDLVVGGDFSDLPLIERTLATNSRPVEIDAPADLDPANYAARRTLSKIF